MTDINTTNNHTHRDKQLATIEDRQQRLITDNRETALNRLGLNDSAILDESTNRMEEVRKLGRETLAIRADDHKATAESRADIISRARRAGRSQGLTFLTPNPEETGEIITDGPQKGGNPVIPTTTICYPVERTILTTPATNGSQLWMRRGPESAVTHQANVDAVNSPNLITFSVTAAGSSFLSSIAFTYHAGFRFNFTPPQAGLYGFQPVVSLKGLASLGDLSPLGFGKASVKVTQRTRASQFGSPVNDGYYYDDVAIHSASVAGDWSNTEFAKDYGPDNEAMVWHEFDQDHEVHVHVHCRVHGYINGLGYIDVDGGPEPLGLEVHELHAVRFECFESPLDFGNFNEFGDYGN